MTLSPFARRGLFAGLILLALLTVSVWKHMAERDDPKAAAEVPREGSPPPPTTEARPRTPEIVELGRDLRLGEVVWRVRGEADQAHLRRALAAGLRETGRIGPLDLVKLSGPLDLLRSWSKPSMEAGVNVPVVLPRLPDAPALDGTRPFEDKLLAFFGLEDRASDWGNGVRIAILDTGIESHPALADAKLSTVAAAPDDNGHGTAVASLIAGNDAYAKGLAPGAELLVYKVLDANGLGDAFGIAEAIVSATDRGAQLISLSAGSTDESNLLRAAVDYATAQGVVIVAAAGNENAAGLLYPAAYENVLAVGAVDANGATARFSNSGSTLDIAAPGVGLYSAYSENRYIEFSGTSAATPVVTGAIAALASQDPFLSVEQASELIAEYSSDAGAPGWDPQTGQGILDPLRVLERNAPNYSDLGISAPYLLPESLETETAQVSLNVQNRGNQFIAAADIVIKINGTSTTHRVVGLETNSSQPILMSIPVAALEGEKGVAFEVTVTPGFRQTDERSENNGYQTVLRLEPSP